MPQDLLAREIDQTVQYFERLSVRRTSKGVVTRGDWDSPDLSRFLRLLNIRGMQCKTPRYL